MLREPGAQLAKRRVLTRRDNVIASEPRVGNGFLGLREVVDAMQRRKLAEKRNRECVVEDAWWGRRNKSTRARAPGENGEWERDIWGNLSMAGYNAAHYHTPP